MDVYVVWHILSTAIKLILLELIASSMYLWWLSLLYLTLQFIITVVTWLKLLECVLTKILPYWWTLPIPQTRRAWHVKACSIHICRFLGSRSCSIQHWTLPITHCIKSDRFGSLVTFSIMLAMCCCTRRDLAKFGRRNAIRYNAIVIWCMLKYKIDVVYVYF